MTNTHDEAQEAWAEDEDNWKEKRDAEDDEDRELRRKQREEADNREKR